MASGALFTTETQVYARGDTVPGSRYTSGRGAAMGDAFIPLADDGASSLFYNPAGIGKIRQTTVETFNFQGQVNSGYASIFDKDFIKVTNLDSYRGTVVAHEGQAPGVAASYLPNFYTRYFAVGMLVNTEFWSQAEGDSIRYRSKYQLIPAAGTGFRMASGVIRVGYSFQWVHQASGDRTVPNDSDPIGYSQGIAQGSGFSHNAGFALTLPFEYLPAFNFVARNIGGLSFSDFSLVPVARDSAGAPANEPMTFDAAVSIQPKLGSGGYMNLVLQYRDLMNASGMSLFGRVSLGAEFSYRDVFFLRGGWGSGYPSAGIGLRRKTADLSLSWYSEELGTSYNELRDSKFMVHYQIRAF